MRVLVYENNLIWSSRLLQSLRALGHEPLLMTRPEIVEAQVAIVNLGTESLGAAELVPRLVQTGIHVIGHAGHREKELLSLGKRAGCQTIATNSEISFKLGALLESIEQSTGVFRPGAPPA